jgi:hypothetical protein
MINNCLAYPLPQLQHIVFIKSLVHVSRVVGIEHLTYMYVLCELSLMR